MNYIDRMMATDRKDHIHKCAHCGCLKKVGLALLLQARKAKNKSLKLKCPVCKKVGSLPIPKEGT